MAYDKLPPDDWGLAAENRAYELEQARQEQEEEERLQLIADYYEDCKEIAQRAAKEYGELSDFDCEADFDGVTTADWELALVATAEETGIISHGFKGARYLSDAMEACIEENEEFTRLEWFHANRKGD